eukprot:8493265-Alexandrium_andersonii.AAC.1
MATANVKQRDVRTLTSVTARMTWPQGCRSLPHRRGAPREGRSGGGGNGDSHAESARGSPKFAVGRQRSAPE